VKRLVWLGSSLDDVRAFSREARQDAGYQPYKVQLGLEPSDWKPMAGIGSGVQEIRLHKGREYRIIYVAKGEEAVYVLAWVREEDTEDEQSGYRSGASKIARFIEREAFVMKKRRSTGNVFRDLGFRPKEAANLKVRAMLMAEMERYLKGHRLTQKQAAERFGVSQPRISNLMRGKIELFSVDTLIDMLTHAGISVDVRLKRSTAA
jgi:predicted XRE-type DNA-binding protein/phage-related protein